MKLPQILLGYVLAAVAFLVLDASWLMLMSERLYRPSLEHLMAAQVDWRAAALFYPVYLAGVLGFAVLPTLQQRAAPRQAGLRGALLGVMAYATYDLTNQATLRDWPWTLTLVDLAWGGVVTAVAAWTAAAGVQATCRPSSTTNGQ